MAEHCSNTSRTLFCNPHNFLLDVHYFHCPDGKKNEVQKGYETFPSGKSPFNATLQLFLNQQLHLNV